MRLFDNRVLRRMPKRDEVRGKWRKLPSEELNDLYSSLNFGWVIKPRKIIWTEHVACMGERRGLYTVLVRDLWERYHLEDPGVDGGIILRWIFRKWNVGA